MIKYKLSVFLVILIFCISSLNMYANTVDNTEEYNISLKYEYTIALSKAMGLNKKIIQDFTSDIDTGDAIRSLLPGEEKYYKKYLLSLYNISDQRVYNNFKFLQPGNSIDDIYPILESELIFLNIPYKKENVIETSIKNGLVILYDDNIPQFVYTNIDAYLQGFLNKKVYYYFDENGNLQINYSRDYTYADLYCERNGIKDKSKLNYELLTNNSNIYATRGDAISTIAKSIGVNDRIFEIESHTVINHPFVADAYMMDEKDVYATLLGGKVIYGSKGPNRAIYAMPERKVTAEEVYTFMLRCLAPTEYNTRDGAKYYNLLSADDRWYNNLNQVITKDELNTINERFLDNKVYYCFIDKVPYDGDDFDVCFDYIIYKYDCIYRELENSENKVTSVDLSYLIRSGANFNGKRVRVEGYGNIGVANELYCYTDNEETIKKSILLDFDFDKLKMPYNDIQKMNDKYVIVEGVFNSKNEQRDGVYSGTIEEVISYELYNY